MNRNAKVPTVRNTPAVGPSFREGSSCKYSHRCCMQNCLEGYEFCIRHILEDKIAPFRQCAYITKAGRKCPTAAPKHEKKEGYCSFHTKKALMARQRLARKRRPRETPDSLLEELVVTTSFMDASHGMEHRRGKIHSDSLATRALDYASSSDSEAEQLVVEHTWKDSGDSDAESIDSDQEDMLKYAGIYTTEEVAQILRDKLIRLQALYIDQFKRLKHILLTKRKKYLQAKKVERELYGSIKRYKKDPHQREKYEKLCAMKRYHKKFGVEALMQRKSTHRRMNVTEGMSHKLPVPARCHFVDEGVKCTQSVIPLSKFCHKHILHDQHQVLFRPCPFADSQCGLPVPSLLSNPFCSLHQPLPPAYTAAPQEDMKLDVDMEPATSTASDLGPESKPELCKLEMSLAAVGSSIATTNQERPAAFKDMKIKSEISEQEESVLDVGTSRDEEEDEDVRGLR